MPCPSRRRSRWCRAVLWERSLRSDGDPGGPAAAPLRLVHGGLRDCTSRNGCAARMSSSKPQRKAYMSAHASAANSASPNAASRASMSRGRMTACPHSCATTAREMFGGSWGYTGAEHRPAASEKLLALIVSHRSQLLLLRSWRTCSGSTHHWPNELSSPSGRREMRSTRWHRRLQSFGRRAWIAADTSATARCTGSEQISHGMESRRGMGESRPRHIA